MMRRRVSKRKSGRIFSRTARRVHKKNLSGSIMRGGIRL